MSFRSLLVAVLMFGASACMEAPAQESHESTVDQAIGVPPSCPAGQSLVFWTEVSGVCGGCTINHKPGVPETEFAACSGNIQGTKTLIQNLCSNPCLL